jgi:hypothetical protein
MSNNIVPIGSIVEINESKYCVIGYGSINKDGKEIYGYYGVISPVGFINLEKLAFIPYANVTNVLFEGYSTDSSALAVKLIEKSNELSEKYSTEQFLELKARVSEIIKKKKEG